MFNFNLFIDWLGRNCGGAAGYNTPTLGHQAVIVVRFDVHRLHFLNHPAFVPFSEPQIRTVYNRYLTLLIFDPAHTHRVYLYQNAYRGIINWPLCPCIFRSPFVAAIVRDYFAGLGLPPGGGGAPGGGVPGGGVPGGGGGVARDILPIAKPDGRVGFPTVPRDEGGWTVLQDVLKGALDSGYPLGEIIFSGGGDTPIPEWFKDWCKENGIKITVLPPDEFDKLFGDDDSNTGADGEK